MWACTLRELRLGKLLSRAQIAEAQPVVAAVVHEPGEDPAVAREGGVVDVLRRLLDPLERPGLERVEGEAAELAVGVGHEAEAAAVQCPRPRHEERVPLVRRQLSRLA